MRVIGLAAAVAAVIAIGSNANADTASDLARCRAISDSLQRLNCYDDLVKPAALESGSEGAFKRVDLTDLKVDRDRMRGEAVEVSGRAMLFGDMLTLGSGDFDSSPIMVDFKNVPRDQRRRLVERCNTGCPVTIKGKIGNVMFQAGVVADAIAVR